MRAPVRPPTLARLGTVSKRRVPPPGQPPERPTMRPWQALAISGLVVAIVIGAGAAIDWAARPHPPAAFAKCRTATQLAPDLYSGPPPMCIDPKATYNGTIKTTKGDITFVFLTKSTPKTVN